MTEVLPVPMQPDSQAFYRPAGRRRSPPSTRSSFFDVTPPSSSPKSQSLSTTPSIESSVLWSTSPTSPPVSAKLKETTAGEPRAVPNDAAMTSNQHTLSVDTHLDLPNYDVQLAGPVEKVETPPPSPASTSDVAESTATDTTVSDSPLATPSVVDDSAVKQHPSRQVDFLSHEWKEEDIWASWRHIVCNRKVYGQKSRLENAIFRQWGKTKHNLRTIAPEQLNWLKESDVTWLYGPLKSASTYPISQSISESSSRISKNNSFVNKKPILKKRSMSEVMLQRSISTSSLVREAATTALFSQRRSTHRRSDASSEFSESKLPSEVPSRDQQDYFTSRSSSFCGTPSETHEKKHIRFDDVVEQCIAVDHKDVGLDEDESDDDRGHNPDGSSGSSDDEGGLMMARRRRRPKRSKAASRTNSHNGRKIIETLPATTLKYRTDSPDITEQAQHHTFGRSWNTSRLSPSPSQETLRPSRSQHSSTNFLQPNDEDDADDMDSDSSWTFSSSNSSDRRGRNASGSSRAKGDAPGLRNDDFAIEGMRRTGSGMFMPDDEEERIATGLFGRVSDTINTARDIAHVIWTVGWRT